MHGSWVFPCWVKPTSFSLCPKPWPSPWPGILEGEINCQNWKWDNETKKAQGRVLKTCWPEVPGRLPRKMQWLGKRILHENFLSHLWLIDMCYLLLHQFIFIGICYYKSPIPLCISKGHIVHCSVHWPSPDVSKSRGLNLKWDWLEMLSTTLRLPIELKHVPFSRSWSRGNKINLIHHQFPCYVLMHGEKMWGLLLTKISNIQY